MENSRKMQTTKELPEVIIQHIQSFLTTKEAAQTTVLSKSWYNSWLTRSTLDFDELHFQKPGSPVSDGFVSFVKKTISRYEKSKLPIKKFLLGMNVTDRDLASLVSEWIVKVTGMGVEYMRIDIKYPGFKLVLPKEVFQAKSLKTLVLDRCEFSRDSEGNVMCFNLERLVLCDVIVLESMVADIFTNCPLLEHVTLLYCKGLPDVVNVSKLLNLRELDFRMLRNPSRLQRTLIEFHDRTLGSVIFRTLTDLVLEGVKVDSAILLGLSYMFPCIKSLSICNCYGCEVLHISSKSLEFMTCEGIFRVLKFDVPCIKTFKFNAARQIDTPLLSFTKCSEEWESHIELTWVVGVTWLVELKSFLSSLSESKISLDLCILGDSNNLVGHVHDSSKPAAVENLTLTYLPQYFKTEVCSQVFYHLFSCFCPKFINQLQLMRDNNTTAEKEWESVDEDFSEDLTCRMVQHGTGMAQGLPCIDGLDGVDVEFFEKTRAEWQPLPWKTLMDHSTIPSGGRKVRYQLKWKPYASAGGAE